MKKTLLLVICILLIVFSTSCSNETVVEQDLTVQQDTSAENATLGELVDDAENEQPVEEKQPAEDTQIKFENYEALTDKFMEYCEAGDLEGVYSLYYNDLLTKTYERISDKVSKEDFDAGITAEMLSIYSFEEFEYGCAEMPSMSSPLSYVNQLLHYSGAEPLNIADYRVTNCVDLRVYKANTAYPSDHMLACIDGYWYFVV